jgi:hypothetical protein
MVLVKSIVHGMAFGGTGTYSDGFQVAARGVQLTNTNTKASIATTTIMAMLIDMGIIICFRWSRRMQVKPIAHLMIVEDMKYRISQ